MKTITPSMLSGHDLSPLLPWLSIGIFHCVMQPLKWDIDFAKL